MNRKLSGKVSAGIVGLIVLASILYFVYERIETHKMAAPKVVTTSHVQLIDCRSSPYAILSIGGYTNVNCRGTVLFTANLYPEFAKTTYIYLFIDQFTLTCARPGSETIFVPRRSDLTFVYDTCRLPNGNHQANLTIGNPENRNPAGDQYDDYGSEDVSFKTDNTISDFHVKGDLVTAHLSTFLADWRIDVLKGSGKSPETLDFQLVRSFKGRGREIRWVWDEKNNLGVHVNDRSATLGWLNRHGNGYASAYFYRITAMRGRRILQQTEPSSANDFYDKGSSSGGDPGWLTDMFHNIFCD